MIHEVIYKNYIKNPDKIAVIDGQDQCTYDQLWDIVQKRSSWLQENFNKQDRIGIVLDNSLDSVYFMYAISAAGMISVPMDSDIHSRNLSYIIKDSSISLIVTESKYKNKLKEAVGAEKIEIFVVDTADGGTFHLINTVKSDLSLKDYQGCKLASILYTTGTTGPRKGVILSHENFLSATESINQFMKIDSSIVESLPMRLSHSFGFARLRSVFDVSGTVILEKGFLRPEKVVDSMLKHKANAISSVPTGFAILLGYYKRFFEQVAPQIRHIEIGSASMRQDHKEELVKLCPKARICMHYGLTEGSRASFIEFHSQKDKLYTIGQASPNVEIKIINENKNDVGFNKHGEIAVKGKMVMQGYCNKEKMTKDSLIDGWLLTGDLGVIDAQGYIHLLGRKKEIINVGGQKVAPGEIEEILLSYEGILEAAVIGLKPSNEVTGESIKTFIVTKNKDISFEDIKRHCLENLESYKIPVEFEIVSSLPRTNSGKIQKHLLIKPETVEAVTD